jgi:hypothetical protein
MRCARRRTSPQNSTSKEQSINRRPGFLWHKLTPSGDRVVMISMSRPALGEIRQRRPAIGTGRVRWERQPEPALALPSHLAASGTLIAVFSGDCCIQAT